jgi:hypothetical protein
MPVIRFIHPEGFDLRNPKVGDVVPLLRRRQKFWNETRHGSGFGTLEFQTRDPLSKTSLLITVADGFGVHLCFREWKDGSNIPTSHFSWNGSDRWAPVATLWMQNRFYLPPLVFVDRKSAGAAVRRFFRDGARSPSIKWLKRSEFQWDIEDARRT